MRRLKALVLLTSFGIALFAAPVVTAQSSTTTNSTPPQPTISQAEAVQQAQSQVATVPTVYDITDPGIVYGLLREGVDSWLATLNASTDQWGIEKSPVYVTAVRPDVVPASLQAFLLQHYSDHPTIALAMGPEGVTGTVTELQNNYNQNVSELSNQIYDNAVQEAINQAENENNAANNSENVPPLDNNDNGNNSNDDPPVAGAPRIAAISPSSIVLDAAAKTIDITGENFGTTAEDVTVDFSNGVSGLAPTSVSDTALSVTLPDDFIANKTISVTVNVAEETSNAVTITVTPSIVSISPEEILDEETLTIYGYGFDFDQDQNNTLTFTGSAPYDLKPTNCSFDTGKNQTVMTIDIGHADLGGPGDYSLSVSTNGEESQATSVTFTSSTT